MSDTKKKKLNSDRNTIKNKWDSLNSQKSLSTREKLEKLVSLNLKMTPQKTQTEILPPEETIDTAFLVHEFTYPMTSVFKDIRLSSWEEISPDLLSLVSGDQAFMDIDALRLVYFDVETTGLSGGTGTIPFMLGFGFFKGDNFVTKIFVLNDLSREEEMLQAVDEFLDSFDFSGTVTYNGKSFDFPLMETRYILYRKRFPLLKKPHLDFLFPARVFWKNTFESCKLGYLGDLLLGISRQDDVDASLIPSLYFSYLRTNRFSLLEKVEEHNAMDLVGLSALLLKGLLVLKDVSRSGDAGEVLGAARFFERAGDFEKAVDLLEIAKQSAENKHVMMMAVKRLAILKKKRKLYEEANELWELLSEDKDHFALRELSIHFEHRRKDYHGALEFVCRAIEEAGLSESQRRDLEKRLNRLRRKIEQLKNEES
jgi:uncharacterized protein YprB with RNaseH-like and TPR domain